MAELLRAGMTLPDATFLQMQESGMIEVRLRAVLAGRKVVIFAVPGAFTPTCDSAHMPSFVRTAEALRAKGVDKIVCVSVNDPHVMRRWDEATGAGAAGIMVLADAAAAFTKAVGMHYSVPERGMLDRSKRYSLLAVDGVVQVFNLEDTPGTCAISAGEAMLDLL